MKTREHSPGSLFLFCILFLLVFALPSTAEEEVQRVMVAMPDGVKLATDVMLPEGDGPFQTVLMRTPYDSRQLHGIGRRFVNAGYALIMQNVRGMGGSEGQFIPFAFEQKDGLACLDWIQSQDWSDGRVGVWGESYLAYCGLVLAVTDHAALKTVINISGMGDMEHFIQPGGVLHLMAHFPWFYLNMAGGQFPPWEQWMEMFATVPVGSLFGQSGPNMMQMFQGIEDEYDQVSLPILHITGWQDFVYESTLRVYEGIERESSALQRLVVGPWYHDQVFTGSSQVGDIDFGEAARRDFSTMLDMSIRWFDVHLRGENPGRLDIPVHLFVMGANQWRAYENWPPEAAAEVPFYLSENGTLTPVAPEDSKSISFIYDPHNPVPTLGGDVFHYFKQFVGFRNHAELLKRDDILSFFTPPLVDPLTIIGPLSADIWLSTEGPDTDVTCWVVIEYPDGRVDLVEEGILRASAAGLGGAEGLQPDQAYRFTVACGATAWEIPVGAKLGLLVSSSNFPKYVRNPNTGEDPMEAAELKAVKQTVHMAPGRESRLRLFVVPQEK